MRVAYLSFLLIFCAVLAVAGSITSATSSVGSVYTANSIADNMNGSSIGAAGSGVSGAISFTYATGGGGSCVFVGGVCSSGGFSVAATQFDTIGGSTSGFWTVTNNTGSTIASMGIGLSGAAWNPCVSFGVISTGNAFGISSSPGAGFCRSVSGDDSPGISASVAYSNAVQLAGASSALADEFTQIMLGFPNTGLSTFTTGSTFGFYGDTDLTLVNPLTQIITPTADDPVPEPTSITLVGLALAGIAAFCKLRVNRA